ncbi:MAG: DUF1571 domain-containing protein [bacterium]|nr:DUF1571 domain-containing protein [bacterium]
MTGIGRSRGRGLVRGGGGGWAAWAAAAALLAHAGCAGVRVPAREPREVRPASGEELDDLRRRIDRAAEAYGGVRDYRCVFHKRHRIGGRLQENQRILLKFMEPMHIYMKWIGGAHEGQEILYAPARHGPKGFARAGGVKGRFMPVIRIDPDGYWVRRDSIHDLDRVGIGYFLRVFMENAARAREEDAGALVDRGPDTVSGRPVRVIEAILPAEREKGYYCHRCVVSFDEEHGLPIRIRIYDWDDRLAEEYVYEDLELNVGLTGADFDRGNEAYGF